MAAVKKNVEQAQAASPQHNAPDVIQLSERDSIAVINSLRYPPKLTPAMQELLKKHYTRL